MAFAQVGKPPENPILWPDELAFSSSELAQTYHLR
jgi:hypothetical protein